MAQQSPERQAAPDAASLLVPALKFGGFTGSAGLIVGGVSGVLRDTPALFFATASGLQWFGLGSTFWGTRSFILQQWEWQYRYNVAKDNAVDAASQQLTTPADRVKASTIAGGVAGGGIGLLTRGPKNVVPGALMFSLFGFTGQYIYNIFFDKSAASFSGNTSSQQQQPQGNFFQRLADKKWTPFSVLSDVEYEDMLKEKILRLDADIALIDDRIVALRALEREEAAAAAAAAAAVDATNAVRDAAASATVHPAVQTDKKEISEPVPTIVSPPTKSIEHASQKSRWW